jgi:hypothetical protein
MYLGRFNSIKFKKFLDKKSLYHVKNGIYGSNHMIYNINHYQTEMEDYCEIINYIYNSLHHNKIKTYNNFYMIQEEHTNYYTDDILLYYKMTHEEDKVPFIQLGSIYSVYYYYNMKTRIVLESPNFSFQPNENDLLLIDDKYKQHFKKSGYMGVLKFNFIK